MNSEIGKTLILLGALIAVVGVVVWAWGDRPFPLGRLPGDMVVERPGFRFYFPITTLLLVNALIWLGIRVWQHFRR